MEDLLIIPTVTVRKLTYRRNSMVKKTKQNKKREPNAKKQT